MVFVIAHATVFRDSSNVLAKDILTNSTTTKGNNSTSKSSKKLVKSKSDDEETEHEHESETKTKSNKTSKANKGHWADESCEEEPKCKCAIKQEKREAVKPNKYKQSNPAGSNSAPGFEAPDEEVKSCGCKNKKK